MRTANIQMLSLMNQWVKVWKKNSDVQWLKWFTLTSGINFTKGLLHFRYDWLSGYAPHQLDQSVIQWTEACMPGNDGAKHTLWLDTRILLMWRHMNGSWHNGHDSELNWFFRITGSDGLHRGSAQKPTLLFCACGSAIAATALVPTQRSERLQ